MNAAPIGGIKMNMMLDSSQSLKSESNNQTKSKEECGRLNKQLHT